VVTENNGNGNVGIIRPIKLEEEMRSSYLDYAMSVIVSRALPDVRDGLKPVQRRILFGMHELGIRPTSSYKKCARIVGEVLGKYHPHGDAPVYDALVRMAQAFSMRYPLIDGQGNFGSVDNDPPAAMRYTEARLAKIAEEMLVDIEKETVDFSLNFDSSLSEPTVLPARLPNLLVNGTSGIAVGMATNIPPHNLSDVCDAIAHLIEHEDASIDDLIAIVKGPDFPTGAMIMGTEGIKNAYHTGNGKIVVKARASVEDMPKSGREQIVITELPYQTNKAALIEKIAELVKDKRIDGISEIRDESDRKGLRIVIELRRDAMGESVLNNLYKMTALKSSFFVNMLALVDGQPRVLNLREILQQYIAFRQEVITRRSRFDLQKARERAHILEGLIIAQDNLDAVIKTIRESADADTARTNLMTRFGLSQAQAQAILDMQLRRLAALERQKILDEHAELKKQIAYLEDLLAHPKKILGVVKDETLKLKEDFGEKRATEISGQEDREFTDEDLIPHMDMVVSISNRGYAKRLTVDSYRVQRRGGTGVRGMTTREMDVVQHLIIVDTHDHLLFFTNKGRVFHSKAYRIPHEATRAAKGTPLINLIPIAPEELVTAVVAIHDFNRDQYLMMMTKRGRVKRTQLKEFAFVMARTSGIIAIKLRPGDDLVSCCIVEEQDHVIAITNNGKAVRFPVADVRAQFRNAGGVRGVKIDKDHGVLYMAKVRESAYMLVVGEKGLGKLTELKDYPWHHRGTGGVLTLRITDKTGPVAAACVVDLDDDLMVTTKKAQMLRTTLRQIRITGRAAQGVRIIDLDEGDTVATVAYFSGKQEEGVPLPPTAPGPAIEGTTAVQPELPVPAEGEEPEAEEEEGDEEEEAEMEQAPAKRGPGRPKKTVPAEAPKRRGRPPGSGKKQAAEALAAQEQPKRRGRPPGSGKKHAPEAPAVQEQPKRRGRPPGSGKKPVVEAAAPKRRGRPPGSGKAKVAAPSAAPKKRGRPPGKGKASAKAVAKPTVRKKLKAQTKPMPKTKRRAKALTQAKAQITAKVKAKAKRR
jgi:DNA gyrase subunit A